MTTYPAPAKINTFLHVSHRQANGYHALQTVFQFIDLCDELTFEPRQDGVIECFTQPEGAVDSESNLVIQAGRLLQRQSQCSLGATINLKKAVFIGAGLGGGSSDAATTLLVLNQLWNTGLTNEQLQTLGSQLGADVPIFIYGKSAWAQDVGDQFSPFKADECWYLLIHPGCHVSTARVFKHGIQPNPCPIDSETAYYRGPLTNDCEPAVRTLYPQIGQTLDLLRQYNAGARLTGTGSCMILPCDSYQEAADLKQKLPAALTMRITKGINLSPLYSVLNVNTM